ncbi:hypothetical protein D3C75_550790 [compost metagenome]
MGYQCTDFIRLDAVIKPQLYVPRELWNLTTGDQGRNGEQATITGGQLLAFPHIAEEQLRSVFVQPRGDFQQVR